MQQKFMLEDIERLLERIKRNPNHLKTMEYWYIEGVYIDMKNSFQSKDVDETTMQAFYGATFTNIWTQYS